MRGLSRFAALLGAMVMTASCSAQSTSANEAVQSLAADVTPVPLADVAASATLGRAIFGDRDAGNCVLCHRITGLDVPFQGDVGPDLTAVGARLSPAQLRFRIVDASRLNPATVMPAYFRTDGLSHVAEAWRGRTVLSGEQVEHLVAYLSSLDEEPLQETGR
jgi:sulfur-oxidizing protein SoxX